MTDPSPSPRARLLPILALATLSGAAALVYEVVFFRSLGLLFGVAIHAVAAVVSVFLGGLGLGAAVGGRWFARGNPLKIYALLEVLTAVYGFVAPFLFRGLGSVITPPAGDDRVPVVTLLASFLLLVWPTFLMGATFPVLARCVAAGRARAAGPVAMLYGWNTIGACLGALLAGYLFLPALGLLGTTHLAAGANVLLAVAALALAGKESIHAPPTVKQEPAPPDPAPGPRVAILVAAVAGFVSIAYQVVGNRLLVAILGGSVYAFAAILAVFLLGIGLGGFAFGGALARRANPWTSFATSLVVLAGSIGLGLVLVRWRLGPEDPLAGALNQQGYAETLSVFDFLGRAGSLALLAFLPATLVSGAIFPALARFLSKDPARMSAGLGKLYAANVVGSILGSLLSAFLLLPSLMLRGSLAAIAGLAIIPVVPLLLRARRAGERGGRAELVVAGAAAAVCLAFGLRPGAPPGSGELTTLFHAESAASAVMVIEVLEEGEETPVRCLFVNGKSVATSVLIDRRLQLLLGFIPTLVHEKPERILSIALGTGMSSGALALSGAEVDVVELSRGVIDACRYFDQWTDRVLERGNVRVWNDDGRAFLARSDHAYDLISADPIHPWVAGSAFLYTEEYYRLARAHLRPGGFMSQWIPLYQLSTEDVAGIARTFQSVFPETSAWVTGYDLILLGGLEERTIDVELVAERMREPRVAALLRDIGVVDVWDLLAGRFAGKETVARLAQLAPAMITDDRPWIEFTAPRSVFAGYTTDVLRLLAESDDALPFAAGLPPHVVANLAAATRRLRDGALQFAEEVETTGRYGTARSRYSEIMRRGYTAR